MLVWKRVSEVELRRKLSPHHIPKRKVFPSSSFEMFFLIAFVMKISVFDTLVYEMTALNAHSI